MWLRIRSFVCLFFLTVFVSLPAAQTVFHSQRAFPGSAGFGTSTPGGRGGKILKVINLNDAGPGSFRNAAESSGRRTVVFEISGTIDLQSEVRIRSPYITIAGQTAPTPGITLKGAELNIQTHNVIVQHIRVRVGDRPPRGVHDIGGIDSVALDGPNIRNVVVDHVSISWGIDENATSWYNGVRDVTFSNCIISEGLRKSIHPKGAHSMGLLISPNARNIAIIGNLLAHNSDRNPLISNSASALVANNVFYNWEGGRATNVGNTSGSIHERYGTEVTIVNNTYIKGPDTPSSSSAISTSSHLERGARIYHRGNDFKGIRNKFRNQVSFNPLVGSPVVWLEGFQPSPANVAEKAVLRTSGARPAERDAVDERIIRQVRSRSGRIINSQQEVGGWPSLKVNRRKIYIPSNANGDEDGDGYTNFEESVLFPMARRVEGRDSQ